MHASCIWSCMRYMALFHEHPGHMQDQSPGSCPRIKVTCQAPCNKGPCMHATHSRMSAPSAQRLKIGPWLFPRPGRSRRAEDAQHSKVGRGPGGGGRFTPNAAQLCAWLLIGTSCKSLHANTSACNQASEHDPSKHARVLRVLAGG